VHRASELAGHSWLVLYQGSIAGLPGLTIVSLAEVAASDARWPRLIVEDESFTFSPVRKAGSAKDFRGLSPAAPAKRGYDPPESLAPSTRGEAHNRARSIAP
jgi:hypothetical protein